jgi:hypothetical protein
MTSEIGTRRASRQATGETRDPLSLSTLLLLDNLSATAAVAYSTRKLRTAYAGKALQIKRSSDNTTMDIGFVGGDLDTTALSSFVGAGTGQISIWYDQSGNAVNAVPIVTVGGVVVSSGSLLTFASSGKASVSFTATAQIMSVTDTVNQPDTIAFVLQATTAINVNHMTDGISGGATRQLVGISGGQSPPSGWQMYAGGSGLNGGTWDQNPHGLIAVFNGASSVLYVDNASTITGNPGTAAFTVNTIGGDNNNNTMNGQLPEYIVFTSSISSGDRSTLKSSWHSYWGTP